VLSLVSAGFFETISWGSISAAAMPIFYGGVLSVGVAYTLQVVAQREAHPAHASILMSLEAVFAAWGGWVVLNETLGLREGVGCAFMLAGTLLSQLWVARK
jgi:drug/metabolite transporter (DMT)-like permease